MMSGNVTGCLCFLVCFRMRLWLLRLDEIFDNLPLFLFGVGLNFRLFIFRSRTSRTFRSEEMSFLIDDIVNIEEAFTTPQTDDSGDDAATGCSTDPTASTTTDLDAEEGIGLLIGVDCDDAVDTDRDKKSLFGVDDDSKTKSDLSSDAETDSLSGRRHRHRRRRRQRRRTSSTAFASSVVSTVDSSSSVSPSSAVLSPVSTPRPLLNKSHTVLALVGSPTSTYRTFSSAAAAFASTSSIVDALPRRSVTPPPAIVSLTTSTVRVVDASTSDSITPKTMTTTTTVPASNRVRLFVFLCSVV
jgi:hypothetical protein